MKVTEPYERKVYYYETDKMGIMHHSNYVRILEESRMFFLEKAGMPFEDIETYGLMMPVISVECEFRSPLVFDEPFAVYPVITKFNGATLCLSYTIKSQKTGQICVTGRSSHCFTDLSLKPVRIKRKYPEIYDIFAENISI